MRTLYTILFFADTLLFLCLSYLFLHKLDTGGSVGIMALIFAGVIASIFLLILLLRNYFKR